MFHRLDGALKCSNDRVMIAPKCVSRGIFKLGVRSRQPVEQPEVTPVIGFHLNELDESGKNPALINIELEERVGGTPINVETQHFIFVFLTLPGGSRSVCPSVQNHAP